MCCMGFSRPGSITVSPTPLLPSDSATACAPAAGVYGRGSANGIWTACASHRRRKRWKDRGHLEKGRLHCTHGCTLPGSCDTSARYECCDRVHAPAVWQHVERSARGRAPCRHPPRAPSCPRTPFSWGGSPTMQPAPAYQLPCPALRAEQLPPQLPIWGPAVRPSPAQAR